MKALRLLSIIALTVLLAQERCLAWQVSGRVLCDANQNTQIDTADIPLKGVWVIVTNLSASFSSSAVTESDGTYLVVLPEVSDTYVVTLFISSLPLSSTILIPGVGFERFSISDAGQVAEVDFLINNPACTTSPGERGCWLTGGGTIGATKTRPTHSFGGNVFPGCSPIPGDGGQWNHVAHQLGLHFQGRAITSVSCGNVPGIPPGSRSPKTPFNFIEFSGTGRLSGIKGNDADFMDVFFFARAEDRAEPGKQVDRYFLNVFTNPLDPAASSIFVVDIDGNAATVDPVPIRSGNLQMHFSSCEESAKRSKR